MPGELGFVHSAHFLQHQGTLRTAYILQNNRHPATVRPSCRLAEKQPLDVVLVHLCCRTVVLIRNHDQCVSPLWRGRRISTGASEQHGCGETDDICDLHWLHARASKTYKLT